MSMARFPHEVTDLSLSALFSSLELTLEEQSWLDYVESALFCHLEMHRETLSQLGFDEPLRISSIEDNEEWNREHAEAIALSVQIMRFEAALQELEDGNPLETIHHLVWASASPHDVEALTRDFSRSLGSSRGGAHSMKRPELVTFLAGKLESEPDLTAKELFEQFSDEEYEPSEVAELYVYRSGDVLRLEDRNTGKKKSLARSSFDRYVTEARRSLSQ